jgi:hypothetical protein
MNIQVTEMLVEAIWLEFKMQLAEIEAWVVCGGCGNTVTRVYKG